MDVNYPIAGVVLLAVILLIIYLIRKNQKDRKEFEKQIIDSELKPEKHEEHKQ